MLPTRVSRSSPKCRRRRASAALNAGWLSLSSVAARGVNKALDRARTEALEWCRPAASSLHPREAALLTRAVRIGSWAWSPAGQEALERLINIESLNRQRRGLQTLLWFDEGW